MDSFLYYAQFADFWQRFNPLTPWGRDLKEARRPLTEAAPLEELWDQTELAAQILEQLSPAALSQLSYHLKRLPRLPRPQPLFDESQIFAFKKFIYNYRLALKALSPQARQAFRLEFNLEPLEEALSRGRQYSEAFLVTDAYSLPLAQVRAQLRQLEEELGRLVSQQRAELAQKYSLEFGGREFLLVPSEALPLSAGEDPALSVEAYDEFQRLVRLRSTPAQIELQLKRPLLQKEERQLEQEVLASLSAQLNSAWETLELYTQRLATFDLSLASAILAKEEDLVRPTLGEGPISIVEGRFLPCLEYCRQEGRPYQPLTIELKDSCNVLFGSNMGGKTIALKTLAFLQLAAQYGLFVPARSFQTRLFHHFHYVGEDPRQLARQGLSGFGFEMRQFLEAWRHFAAPSLCLFDEFARTTNSTEAEALLSAILAELATRPQVVALFSTHFRQVARLEGVSYWRMGGLQQKLLAQRYAEQDSPPPDWRQLDRFLDYTIWPAPPEQGSSDALEIAQLLGVEPQLIARARQYLIRVHD